LAALPKARRKIPRKMLSLNLPQISFTTLESKYNINVACLGVGIFLIWNYVCGTVSAFLYAENVPRHFKKANWIKYETIKYFHIVTTINSNLNALFQSC
jgi:hypothetical protein